MTLNCHCPTEDGDQEHLKRAGMVQKSEVCLHQSGSDVIKMSANAAIGM